MNKTFVYWFKFQWSLFLRVPLPISESWFRKWLGAEQATSHNLEQFWPSSLMHICGTEGDELLVYVQQKQWPLIIEFHMFSYFWLYTISNTILLIRPCTCEVTSNKIAWHQPTTNYNKVWKASTWTNTDWLDPISKHQRNFDNNLSIFIEKYALQNIVCNMVPFQSIIICTHSGQLWHTTRAEW